MGEMNVDNFQEIKNSIQPDGSLKSLGWYLNWNVGDLEACLDGRYTAKQLREIANWMDAHAPQK